MTRAAQDTAEVPVTFELFEALLALGSRLACVDSAPAAIELCARAIAEALGATRGPALVDELHAGPWADALAVEAARHAGRVGVCRIAGSEIHALLVPVRAPLPPFELLVFRRRASFSELEQRAASLAAAQLEAALQKRALLDELRDSRVALEQSDRVKSVGQLASGVAHDFNNLLMVISAAAEVMADTLPERHPSASQLGLILDTSHRAAELTRKLLAFSRKGRPVMKPIDAHEVLGTVREFLAHGIDRRIRIQLSLCDGPCMLDADPTQLESALLNVCLNARDAMPDGGVLQITTRRAELDAAACAERFVDCEPGPYLRIDIADTGTGMDAQTLERAFEPFFTTKEPGRGTGLGLPVVLAAVREHQGTVVLESEAGGGTTCSILLPLREQRATAKASTGPGSRRLAALRILLVDDEPRVCLTAAQLMRQLGHNVQALCSGEKALSHLRVHSSGYDLLVLDVMMPHPTGLELHQALTREGIDLPTLFVSGSAHADGVDARLECPGIVFLPKPFRQADLAQAIARSIEAWQSRAPAVAAPLRAG
ncbi:MAG TPA: ATP-binding protein [Polyangiaceae bacterium]|nr:ATP-binding protein [Polyangiaceae bacterium]